VTLCIANPDEASGRANDKKSKNGPFRMNHGGLSINYVKNDIIVKKGSVNSPIGVLPRNKEPEMVISCKKMFSSKSH
jgi:hypothetical protein